MLNEKSPLIMLSTKDVIKFLDGIREVLGLSQEQMDTTILLLDKCETCDLNFRIGNMLITFDCLPSEDSDEKQITVERYIRQGNCASSIRFDIPQVYIRSVKKKSSIAEST